MSEKQLHQVADSDTPRAVDIPQGWSGLAIWAIGRFGVGVLFAGVFGWWLMTVYGDLRHDADKVLSAFQQQAIANANTVTALQQLTLAVERIAVIQKEVDRNGQDISSLKRRMDKTSPPQP